MKITFNCFIFLSLFFCNICTGQNCNFDTANPKINFLSQLKKLAEKMEVFPVDFIAPEGPFSDEMQGREWPRGVFRTDLSREQFRLFYSFCDLALKATEEDVKQCMKNIDACSPKEKALILSVIYIYAYPWRDFPEIFKKNEQGNIIISSKYFIKERFSWLEFAIHTENFLPVKSMEQPFFPEKREVFKRFIEQYQSNESIAFSAVEPVEDTPAFMIRKTDDLRQKIIAQEATMSQAAEFKGNRTRYLEAVKKYYPDCYLNYVSDTLFISYVRYCWPANISLGTIPEWQESYYSNASSTPKTVGQIATQLLESWEPVELDEKGRLRRKDESD